MATPRSFVWAFGSTKKETTFATAQVDGSMNEWVTCKEADFTDQEIGYRTDADEINGYLGETEHQEESRKGKVSRKFNASVEIIAWALAMILGKISSAGTTPNYTHTVKFRDVCTINPPSFSFVEALNCAGLTGTYWLYKGCVINQVTIEVNGKGAVQLTVEIMTDGSETAKTSFTLPASFKAVNKLIGSMLTVSVNSVDISSLMRNLKITINAGIVEPPGISGVTVSEYQYGGNNPKLDVEFTFKGNKSHAIYGYMQNKTVVPVNVALTYNSNRSVALAMTQTIVNAVVKPSGNETQMTVKVMEEHNSTDQGPGVFTVKTGDATYLVAA